MVIGIRYPYFNGDFLKNFNMSKPPQVDANIMFEVDYFTVNLIQRSFKFHERNTKKKYLTIPTFSDQASEKKGALMERLILKFGWSSPAECAQHHSETFCLSLNSLLHQNKE
jgi:hypothetical protein